MKDQVLEEIKFTNSFDSMPGGGASVSRYLATTGGLFRITPGMVLGRSYDALDEPWFLQSTLYQDRCVFTRAGYSPTADKSLVTVSRALHTPRYVQRVQ